MASETTVIAVFELSANESLPWWRKVLRCLHMYAQDFVYIPAHRVCVGSTGELVEGWYVSRRIVSYIEEAQAVARRTLLHDLLDGAGFERAACPVNHVQSARIAYAATGILCERRLTNAGLDPRVAEACRQKYFDFPRPKRMAARPRA